MATSYTNAESAFRGDLWFCSNFYQSPIDMDGIVYATSEHAYQAGKSDSLEYKYQIAACASPGQAKREGRKCAIRPDWEQVKLDHMRRVLALKFSEGSACATKLLATCVRELVEHNNWRDVWWGVCDGIGQNWLGKLLMARRAELREMQAEVEQLGVLEESGLAMAQAALAQILERTGLTQTEIARRMRRPKSFLNRMLRGEANLTLKTFARALAACGCYCDFLAGVRKLENR